MKTYITAVEHSKLPPDKQEEYVGWRDDIHGRGWYKHLPQAIIHGTPCGEVEISVPKNNATIQADETEDDDLGESIEDFLAQCHSEDVVLDAKLAQSQALDDILAADFEDDDYMQTDVCEIA